MRPMCGCDKVPSLSWAHPGAPSLLYLLRVVPLRWLPLANVPCHVLISYTSCLSGFSLHLHSGPLGPGFVYSVH